MATLTGTPGNNVIHGTTTADTISGLAGNDRLYGSKGDDSLGGDDGNDFVDGGAGHDAVGGGDGDDTLYGGPGNDSLLNSGPYYYSTDEGDDVAYGGPGDDFFNGAEVSEEGGTIGWTAGPETTFLPTTPFRLLIFGTDRADWCL
jgi:serralysin